MLTVVYDAINAELAEINAYTRLLVGQEHIASHDPPPKMVVFPNDDEFSGAMMPGDNPRAIASVFEGSMLVIHGETIEHVTGMRDQFYIALRAACKKSEAQTPRAANYRVSNGKWTRAQFIATKGWEYTLRFGVLAAIAKVKWPDIVPPQPPVASSYAGLLTYPIVPRAELTVTADVGVRDNPPADDNPNVTVPEE